MKIGRKLGERARAAATPALDRLLPADAPGPDPAPDPIPPLTGPQAVYARVLDGDSLWLALTDIAEPVGVRREGTTEVVVPASDAPPDEEVISLRWHLPSALPGDDAAVFEVVTASGAPVRSRPLPDQAPMRTPPSRDGRWQFAVRRREGGALVLRRDARDRAAEVIDVVLVDDGVVLTLSDPGLGAARLRLVTAAGDVVGEMPASRTDDGLVAVVRAGDVPLDQGVHWFLALGNDHESVPVLRHRNDNAMPGRSTVLPLLWTGEGESRSMVRLQYQLEARVRVNRPAPTPDGETEDGAG